MEKNKKELVFKILNTISVLIVVFIFTKYYLGFPEREINHVQLLITILVLTFFTRTIGIKQGINIYARAILIGVGGALLVGAIYTLIGIDVKNDYIAYAITLPITEEIAKLLPVLLSAYVMYKTNGIPPNLSDWLLMGIISGVAFGMCEDFYKGDLLDMCWNCNMHYGIHIGNLYLFPEALGYFTMTDGWDYNGYIGHGAATGLIAATIGLGIFLKRMKGVKYLWWIIPLVGFSWITFEHMGKNSYEAGRNADLSLFTNIFVTLGGGTSTPWIMLAIVVLVIGIDVSLMGIAIRKSKMLKGLVTESAKRIKEFFANKKIPSYKFVKALSKNLRFLNRSAWYNYLYNNNQK
ncbi:MAG: hypothetical protein WCT36_01205 [Candidatus Gracilibacteria bacterium]